VKGVAVGAFVGVDHDIVKFDWEGLKKSQVTNGLEIEI
jgi:hypothetical protein